MNHKRNPFVFILSVALLSALPSLWAGARKVYVQGKLTDGGGTPLSGAQTVTFKLYDAATAGTMVWTSGVLSVTPASGGLFNVPLQDGTPSLDSVSFDKPYFLGITVGADAEMIPRQELGASALAHGSPKDFSVAGNLTVSIPSSDQGLSITDKGFNYNPVLSLSRNGSPKLKITAQSNEGHIAGTGTGGLFLGGSDGAEHVVIANNGNVGVGTTTPQAKVHAVATGLEVMRLERTNTAPAQYRFHLQPVMNGDNSDLQLVADTNATGYGFYVRNSLGTAIHGLGIDRSGNVGVGTESPQYRLDVGGSVHCTGTFVSSDRRLKKNIQGFSKDILGEIGKLNGVSYEWDRARLKEMGFGHSNQMEWERKVSGRDIGEETKVEEDDFSGRQIGLIAQEVGEVFPDLVHSDSHGIKSVNYSALTAVLLEGMKAQQKQISELREEVNQLRKKTK